MSCRAGGTTSSRKATSSGLSDRTAPGSILCSAFPSRTMSNTCSLNVCTAHGAQPATPRGCHAISKTRYAPLPTPPQTRIDGARNSNFPNADTRSTPGTSCTETTPACQAARTSLTTKRPRSASCMATSPAWPLPADTLPRCFGPRTGRTKPPHSRGWRISS